MPVLGKPLNYNRGSKRDARYRKVQSRVYNFLERPRGLTAILYHIMVFLMVFTCLALSVFSTIEEYEKDALYILFRMELLVVVWFTFEFFARLWSSGCRSRYQGCIGRLKFLKRPFCIVDMITIVASIVVLGMGASGQVFATSALRGLRFFQILRMVRMDRRGGTWKLLGSVVYAHRQELFTTMYIGFLGLIFASFLVYLMEKDVNVKFNNFAQALWWGVITLCTVGYGDMVPETWQGKLIASFCALLGISFFALPAGILGSGFALKVQQQQRQKHMIRRRQPAATLIQSLWRCYAADENSISTATWKMHQVILPSPPASRTSSSFKHNASFVARLPTIRKHKSQYMPPPPPSNGGSGGSFGVGIGGGGGTGGGGVSGTAGGGGDGINFKSGLSLNRTTSTTASTTRYTTRTLRELNQSVENLEVVLNGRSLNPSFSEDSVADTTFLKAKNSDDEDEVPHCTQLTNQHKTAIRFIRKLKYFVARRKFKEALKPYDVKDVMEQYAAGHVDLLGRVKNVHARLDQILGKQGSKSKDAYASKVSLASRIVKVERQVADIEEKLDMFIKTYMDDRQQMRMNDYSFQISRHSKNNRLQQQQKQQYLKKDLFTKSIEIQEGPLNEQNIITTDSFDTIESKSITNTAKICSDFKKSSDKIDGAITSKSDIQYFMNDFLTDIEGRNLKKVMDSRSMLRQWQNKDVNRRDVSIAIPDMKSNLCAITNREQRRTDSSIIVVDNYENLELADNDDNSGNCDNRQRNELKSCYPNWDVETGAVSVAVAVTVAAENEADKKRSDDGDEDEDGDGDVDVDGDDNTAENTALLNQISITLTPTTTPTVNQSNSLHSLQDNTDVNTSTTWLTPKSG